MIIIVPIAGRGSRFKEEGYKDPKPLVKIKGKPMVQWALESIPFYKKHKVMFIVLKSDIDNYHIDKRLKELFGDNVDIIVSEKVTEGAPVSILLAKNQIDNEEELIIYNADQYFKANMEEKIKNKAADTKGIILVFKATHPKWSYVKVDSLGYVKETAEKVPISTHATAGLYYFSKGRDFVWATEQMIKKDIRRNNEFFVCPVYNEMIEKGDKITTVETKDMWSFATPEDVKEFEDLYTD